MAPTTGRTDPAHPLLRRYHQPGRARAVQKNRRPKN